MRHALLALAVLIPVPLAAQQAAPTTPYDSVDPFIGTGGEGHTYPGATAPFGMVQLSPDTNTECKIRDCYPWAAGYRYDDPAIDGFSHTHFSGSGHSDLGDLLVMPVAGNNVPLRPATPRPPATARATSRRANARRPAIMRST